MANSRIKDLPVEIGTGEIQALLATLYLATDATSFSDAKKILLSTILSSTIVSDNSVDYRALTPKGFYESLSTENRLGIIQLAKDADIAAKTGDVALISSKIDALQETFKADWFFGNGTVKQWTGTSSDLATTKTLQYVVNWEGDLNTGDIVQLVPDGWVASGARFEGVYAQLNVKVDGLGTLGGSYKINKSDSSDIQVDIYAGVGGISLIVTTSGVLFGIKATSPVTGVKISMNVNAILV